MLSLVLPKGSLEKATLELFDAADLTVSEAGRPHVEFLQAARTVGFRACDCVIKIRKGPIVDPKWKIAHHTRRQHCYWLVFRKSYKCE